MLGDATTDSAQVAPTTAERIRSACARGGSAILAAEGADPSPTPVHHLLDDGSFAIMVPAGGPLAALTRTAGAAGIQAVLEMTDYAPLPLREPVRSLVWISGRLFHVPPIGLAGLLDLIAETNPNPALLQVNTESFETDGGDTPYTLVQLEIDS